MGIARTWNRWTGKLPGTISEALRQATGGDALFSDWMVATAIASFLRLPARERADLAMEMHMKDWEVPELERRRDVIAKIGPGGVMRARA